MYWKSIRRKTITPISQTSSVHLAGWVANHGEIEFSFSFFVLAHTIYGKALLITETNQWRTFSLNWNHLIEGELMGRDELTRSVWWFLHVPCVTSAFCWRPVHLNRIGSYVGLLLDYLIAIKRNLSAAKAIYGKHFLDSAANSAEITCQRCLICQIFECHSLSSGWLDSDFGILNFLFHAWKDGGTLTKLLKSRHKWLAWKSWSMKYSQINELKRGFMLMLYVLLRILMEGK